MNVNVEFLDEDPIENVVTCIHYKMDKVIYFGYKEDIEELEEITTRFLKNRCGVKNVEFYEVPELNLNATIEILKYTIDKEERKGSNIFIDVTGGESAVIMAFGMLIKEHDFSSHIYDIENDKVVELTAVDGGLSIVPKNNMVFDIDAYFEMHGASINYDLQKEQKKELSEKDVEDLCLVWKIARDIPDEWNIFCNTNASFISNEADEDEMGYIIEKNRKKMKTIHPLLERCVQQKLIGITEINSQIEHIVFKNEFIKSILCTSGNLLEMVTYQYFKNRFDHCKVGIYIDWDGRIYNDTQRDVFNELDVFYLDGLVPHFVSCKNGRFNVDDYYELETLANEFGGNYSKKEFVVAKGVSKYALERAKSMDINFINMMELMDRNN